jgi:hypothetical protein
MCVLLVWASAKFDQDHTRERTSENITQLSVVDVKLKVTLEQAIKAQRGVEV